MKEHKRAQTLVFQATNVSCRIAKACPKPLLKSRKCMITRIIQIYQWFQLSWFECLIFKNVFICESLWRMREGYIWIYHIRIWGNILIFPILLRVCRALTRWLKPQVKLTDLGAVLCQKGFVEHACIYVKRDLFVMPFPGVCVMNHPHCSCVVRA